MRRSIIGIFLSIVTFSVGFAIAGIRWQSAIDAQPPSRTIECPEVVAQAPKVEVPKPIEAATPDFIAQLTDLEDFADQGYSEAFKTKLVDVHEHENAYRSSEVIAKSGERWIGLFEKNERLYLKTTLVNVKYDPTYEGYGDEDYVRLTTRESGNPVFVLKNARPLKSGSIESAYLRPTYREMERRRLYDKPTKVGFEEYYTIGGKEYAIRVNRGLTKANEKVVAMMLSVGETSQAITYLPYNSDEDTVGHIVWVGDLDGDRKLDLYLEGDGYEKCGFYSSLLLSTAAKKGELVRQVASFGTAGC
ncbi:MAG: hypothetical protein ABIR33_09305 [Pyrinomonadaceae bacterium]